MDTNLEYGAARGLPAAAAAGQAGAGFQDAVSPDEATNSDAYTIGEMARDFQVTIRALRFYEDRGLLRPQREGGIRRYDARDRLRLKMILKGKQLGFTLSEIDSILAGRGSDSGKPDLEMGLSLAQIVAQIGYLERQRARFGEAIAALREAQSRLPVSSRHDAAHLERSGN